MNGLGKSTILITTLDLQVSEEALRRDHATQLRLSPYVTRSLDGRVSARQSHALVTPIRKEGYTACSSFICIALLLYGSHSIHH